MTPYISSAPAGLVDPATVLVVHVRGNLTGPANIDISAGNHDGIAVEIDGSVAHGLTFNLNAGAPLNSLQIDDPNKFHGLIQLAAPYLLSRPSSISLTSSGSMRRVPESTMTCCKCRWQETRGHNQVGRRPGSATDAKLSGCDPVVGIRLRGARRRRHTDTTAYLIARRARPRLRLGLRHRYPVDRVECSRAFCK